MTGRFDQSRRLVLWMAAIALLLNSLVPAGFMLHATESAGLTVVLCPDQGLLPGYPDDAHHQSALQDKSPLAVNVGDASACVFSVATGPVLSAGILVLYPPEFRSPFSPVRIEALARPGNHSHTEARGPPAVS